MWLDELRRQLIRLDEASPRIAVGKFLGAVGTGAAQGEHARELQRLILTHLGLGVPLATTQVVGRDRYVEYVSWLANVATTCEKVLQEIRNLQRSELAEAGEGFDVKKQVVLRRWPTRKTQSNRKMLLDSHVLSDRSSFQRTRTHFCGMSATLQIPAANASRFRMHRLFVKDVMAKMADVLTNMWVDKERCLANIHAQKGLVMAEKVMIELVDHGMPRDEAHEVLREASFEAVDKGEELIDVCSRTPAIAAAFSAGELEAMFNPFNHVGVAGEIVDECVELARKAIQ